MARKESSGNGRSAGPTIVLVEPQLGENIGAAARAMLNCSLTDLRLVRPRDGWPNLQAKVASSGADQVLDGTRVFSSTAEAVADLSHLYATTARSRDMAKPVVTPRQAALEMRDYLAAGAPCGVLFGPERTGLSNDDVVLADTILAVPVNPTFSSLNLAHAVLLVAYEWAQGQAETVSRTLPQRSSRPATKEELVNLFEHLESELDAGGFLYPPEKRPIMVRSIRNILQRAQLTEQEVRTFHGIVTSLAGRRKGSPKE
jgi:tRNA/rRNA methyltransferase